MALNIFTSSQIILRALQNVQLQQANSIYGKACMMWVACPLNV